MITRIRNKPDIPDHEVLRRISTGGYGEVWLARAVTGVHRAVKIVYRDRFDTDKPFEREYRGIREFEPVSRSHSGFVDILQVGRQESTGYFYYVMELADSRNQPPSEDVDSYLPRTLQEDMRSGKRIPVENSLAIGLQLCEALEQLHQHGLVHRDIKPSNIIFVDGKPKLADIGLVTRVDATRTFVGTEGFIAPEGPGTPQADLYGLGKVLYEISTGQDRKQYPDLPIELGEFADRKALLELFEIIIKACAPNLKRRYQTASELRDDLSLLRSGRSVRRLLWLERRQASIVRATLIVLAVATLAVLGFVHQRHQNQRLQAAYDAVYHQSYARDLYQGWRELQLGRLGEVHEVLNLHSPRDGKPDLRSLEYQYLWKASRPDNLAVNGVQSNIL